jgi:hypothetical protein
MYVSGIFCDVSIFYNQKNYRKKLLIPSKDRTGQQRIQSKDQFMDIIHITDQTYAAQAPKIDI